MEWHSKSISETLRLLKTNCSNGLSPAEAKRRIKENGKNILTHEKHKSLVVRFLEQFKDFMVLILLAAAAVSFITAFFSSDGDLIDPVMILIIVILNAVIGTVQECRAEKAIDALKKLSAPHTTVIRSGKRVSVLSEEIAVGDIICFESGDLICADSRLIEGTAVKAEESSLTGEAVPSEKNADRILPDDTPPADRCNMLYASTFVTSGHGKAVVTATGMDTQVGRIAAMLSESETPPTPLQKSLSKTGKMLGISAVIICIVIFVLGLFQHIPALEMLMISVSLAVAAIPEGLPAVVTIVLAMGVRRLAAKRAVVRRLPAVETLGSASVICSDKTGTLTQNKMTVEALSDLNGTASPHSSSGRLILTLGTLCNNSTISKTSSGFSASGDPTETAIVTSAAENGLVMTELQHQFIRVKEIPFDSTKKRMVTVHKLPSGGYRTIAKGAPDILISLCRFVQNGNTLNDMNPSIKNRLSAANDKLSAQAMRVIAVAFKDTKDLPDERTIEKDLCFCGLIGMTDPPRPQAYGAVAECRKAGIKTVMITGDHIITAKAVAEKLGIFRPGDRSATGPELQKISQEELSRHIFEYSVFARVSPEHKVRIVKAFQSRGAVVAMTGDGVNDAPALQCADIGCAMGKCGTDVARNSADMVLTDDNFATIVSAAMQGRAIFDNIRKTIHFLLSSNIGEILTVLCSFLMRLPPPLLAIQLLWVNLITDSLPALALGAEPVKKDVMERRPSDNSGGIFKKQEVSSIIIEGCFIGALSFLAYSIGRLFFDAPGETIIGRTMTFAVLSLSQLVHSFNLRSTESVFRTGISGNPKLIASFIIGTVMQVSVISIPALCAVFKTAPLSPVCWLITAALSLAPLIIVEIEKLSRSHR